MKELKDKMKLTNNMISFIEIVKKDKKIFNLESDDMIKYLEKNKLDKINNSYTYLTDMSFMQLSQSNLEKLESKMKNFKLQYKTLESKNKKDLWLEDLMILVKQT